MVLTVFEESMCRNLFSQFSSIGIALDKFVHRSQSLCTCVLRGELDNTKEQYLQNYLCLQNINIYEKYYESHSHVYVNSALLVAHRVPCQVFVLQKYCQYFCNKLSDVLLVYFFPLSFDILIIALSASGEKTRDLLLIWNLFILTWKNIMRNSFILQKEFYIFRSIELWN